MAGPEPKLHEITRKAADFQTAEERVAYLDDACQGDAQLRAQVEELLQTQRGAGGLFQQHSGTDLPPPTGAETLEVSGEVPTQDLPLAERPETLIGPYKLLQQLGVAPAGLVQEGRLFLGGLALQGLAE